MFLGDTWYHDGYQAVGQNYDIDVAILTWGEMHQGLLIK